MEDNRARAAALNQLLWDMYEHRVKYGERAERFAAALVEFEEVVPANEMSENVIVHGWSLVYHFREHPYAVASFDDPYCVWLRAADRFRDRVLQDRAEGRLGSHPPGSMTTLRERVALFESEKTVPTRASVFMPFIAGSSEPEVLCAQTHTEDPVHIPVLVSKFLAGLIVSRGVASRLCLFREYWMEGTEILPADEIVDNICARTMVGVSLAMRVDAIAAVQRALDHTRARDGATLTQFLTRLQPIADTIQPDFTAGMVCAHWHLLEEFEKRAHRTVVVIVRGSDIHPKSLLHHRGEIFVDQAILAAAAASAAPFASVAPAAP